MNRPLVSVVVPSMNRATFIAATLDSVLAQDYPYIECIVMDGGSRDRTVDILHTYGDRISWVSERDKGQADAIDRGLRRSRGEICTWLNADDVWWGAGAISAVVARFENFPKADVLYGDCAAIDASGRRTGDAYVVRGWSLRYAIEQADHCIPQPSAFIRRRALERVGFLDTSVIFMDRDLWLRIGLTGDIQYVPICLSAARTHENHWHKDYRRAAEEWISTSEKILRHPALPKDLGIRRSVSMANACLRAMQYAWVGRRFGETVAIGARALRHRPGAIFDLTRQIAVYAEQDGRRMTASILRMVLRAGWLIRAMWRRFGRADETLRPV
jgi:glycosyltransferase involved in cell wall biosynthesis